MADSVYGSTSHWLDLSNWARKVKSEFHAGLYAAAAAVPGPVCFKSDFVSRKPCSGVMSVVADVDGELQW